MDSYETLNEWDIDGDYNDLFQNLLQHVRQRGYTRVDVMTIFERFMDASVNRATLFCGENIEAVKADLRAQLEDIINGSPMEILMSWCDGVMDRIPYRERV